MRISTGLVLVLLTLWQTAPTQASEDQEQREITIEYPATGVELGRGWNASAGTKTYTSCIAFQPDSDPAAQTDLSFVQEITDRQELKDVLRVDMEFRMQSILGMGGSAKANYSNVLELKTEEQNFLLYALVRNKPRYVAPAAASAAVFLKPEYAELAKSNPAKFRTICGDHFVASITTGAEFLTTIGFKSTDRRRREEIKSRLEAKGFMFSGSAEFFKEVDTISKQTAYVMRQQRTGGSGDPIPVTKEQVIRTLGSMRQLAANNGLPIQMSLQQYDQLQGWPSDADTVTTWLNYERTVRYFETLKEFYTLYQDAVIRPSDYWTCKHARCQIKEWRITKDRVAALMKEAQQALSSCVNQSDRARCAYADDKVRALYDERVWLPVSKKLVGESCVVNPIYPSPPPQCGPPRPADLAKEEYGFRFESVAQARCNRSISDPECLTEAELQLYYNQLKNKNGVQ